MYMLTIHYIAVKAILYSILVMVPAFSVDGPVLLPTVAGKILVKCFTLLHCLPSANNPILVHMIILELLSQESLFQQKFEVGGEICHDM